MGATPLSLISRPLHSLLKLLFKKNGEFILLPMEGSEHPNQLVAPGCEQVGFGKLPRQVQVHQEVLSARWEYPVCPGGINFFTVEKPFLNGHFVREFLRIADILVPLRGFLRSKVKSSHNPSAAKAGNDRQQSKKKRFPVHKKSSRKVLSWHFHFTRGHRGRTTASGE